MIRPRFNRSEVFLYQKSGGEHKIENQLTHVSLFSGIGGLPHRLSMRVGGLSLFRSGKALAGGAEIPGYHDFYEGGVF